MAPEKTGVIMGRFLKFMTETQAPGVIFEPIATTPTTDDSIPSLLKFIDYAVTEYVRDSSHIVPLSPGYLNVFNKYIVTLGHPVAANKSLNDEQRWNEFIKERSMTKTKSTIGFSSFASNPWAQQANQWNRYSP